ncbi:MAG: hypothetical protein OXG08_10355 [Gammaproteobacteria bacterium]|nr:hypothetical protein [Gammaproteobacteria bacterium]
MLIQTGVDCLLTGSNSANAHLQFLTAQDTVVEFVREERVVPAVTQDWMDEMSRFTRIMEPEVDEGEENNARVADDARDFSKAQEILDDLLSANWLNDNERAQVHQSYAWLAQDQEQPRLAIKHLTEALEYRESMNFRMEERLLYGLSRLHFSVEDYGNALKYAQQSMDRAQTVNDIYYPYMARIYLNLGELENAKEWIEKAIDKKNED